MWPCLRCALPCCRGQMSVSGQLVACCLQGGITSLTPEDEQVDCVLSRRLLRSLCEGASNEHIRSINRELSYTERQHISDLCLARLLLLQPPRGQTPRVIVIDLFKNMHSIFPDFPQGPWLSCLWSIRTCSLISNYVETLVHCCEQSVTSQLNNQAWSQVVNAEAGYLSFLQPSSFLAPV